MTEIRPSTAWQINALMPFEDYEKVAHDDEERGGLCDADNDGVAIANT